MQDWYENFFRRRFPEKKVHLRRLSVMNKKINFYSFLIDF